MKALFRWTAVGIIGIGLGVMAYNAFVPKENEDLKAAPAGAPRKQALQVRTQVMEPRKLTDAMTISGSLLPNEEVNLSFETSGKITDIYFQEGQRAHKGQLLAKLNDATLQANLRRLQAQQQLTEDRLRRQRILLEKEAVSKEAFQEAEAALLSLPKGKRSSQLFSDDDPGIVYSGPMVVLTSKLSASAAEIFSAALRDSGRAVMVGDSRTFGKSTVLNVEDLSPYNAFFRRISAGTVIFESAMFYRINGCSVQQLGVQPDILLPSLSEEMEIGEMYFDNHLPWDQTASAAFKVFDPAMKDKISVLKANSAKRIAASSEYGKLIRQIELYRKIRNRKVVSLNESKRRKEHAAEKQLIEETEKIMEESGSISAEKKSQSADPVLSEAVNIAADLAVL